MDYEKMLTEYIEATIKEGGSDLHLAAGAQPTLRVSGSLIPLLRKEALTHEQVVGMLTGMLTEEQQKRFTAGAEVDFSYSYKNDEVRFRGNAYYHRNGAAIALRLIPGNIQTLEELHLPTELEQFVQRQQGFFLVVGPVGSGKSTTLAALLEMINRERTEHIVTIEHPIEYTFEPKKALIHQREVRIDTEDFTTGLESVFREDVDVLMIGEMRNTETISAAVTAAETGHLVLSTLHTNDAAQTIDRIIDSFPANQQDQIRVQLAASLAGIFSQRLLPRVSGGRIPAYELLLNSKAVSNLIRERRTQEINTVIGTGAEQGMVSMNRSLVDLIRRGEITTEDAYAYSQNPKELERLL